MSDSPAPRPLPQLSPVHRRILGVMVEKSMTTPAGYPLTLAALVTGCNQLTCRNPVMHLSEGEVSRAVHELQVWPGGGLVRQAEVDRTARSNRFEHTLESRFGWDKRERALIAELFLRGPQTPGELKTNASRMTPFDDLQMVMNLLEELARHDPPYVRELPRQPGRSAARYDHLFYLPDETPAAGPVVATPAAAPAGSTLDLDAIEQRVARLEEQVATLREQLGRILQQPPNTGQS